MTGDLSFIQNIPFREYLAETYNGHYLTSHFLSDFRNCPLLYKQKLCGDIVVEDTAAFQIGRATHSLVLRGQESFETEYLVSEGPINPKTGESYGKASKAYKEWASAQSKIVLSPVEFEFIRKLQLAVWAHHKAEELLTGSCSEATVRAEYCGEPVQIRMDAFNPSADAIIDLKTCDNLDYFRNDCFRFGYINQMSFYREVFRVASGGVDTSTWLIGVEKREPYRCGVWQLSGNVLDKAQAQNEMALAELKSCHESGVWPTRYEEVRVIDDSPACLS